MLFSHWVHSCTLDGVYGQSQLMTVLPGARVEPPCTLCASSPNLALWLPCVCLVWSWVSVLVSCLVLVVLSENGILPWILTDLVWLDKPFSSGPGLVPTTPNTHCFKPQGRVWKKDPGEDSLCLAHHCLPHASHSSTTEEMIIIWNKECVKSFFPSK